MKTFILLITAVTLFAISSCNTSKENPSDSSTASANLPSGWFITGDNAESYSMGIDSGSGQDGKNAATIKSIEKSITGFGTLMQWCKADKYKGKQIKMTGSMKSANVKDWAGFWLRIDQEGSGEPLGFDNMMDRGIKKTTDWKTYEIVIDVPGNASRLAYGALLSGTGQIWFDNMAFEIVSDSIKSSSPVKQKETSILNEPDNLNFEK